MKRGTTFRTWAAALTMSCAVATAPAVAQVAAKPAQFGVNLAGCAAVSNGALCPNSDDVAWWMGQGFGTVRLAFRDQTPRGKVYASTDLILARGGTVILDRHENKWPSVADQISAWTSAIGKYRGNSHVVIGLMNEPSGFSSTTVPNNYMQWALDTRAIIAGLRANGVTNTIAVEWPGSSAAFRFDKHEPAYKDCESAVCALDRTGGLRDSNVIFEPHFYFDPGSSGTSSTCQQYLVIDNTRASAAARGYKLLLGEAAFGSWKGASAACTVMGLAAIAEIKLHPETWAGVTWWGAGREWSPNYIFAAGPKGHRDAGSYVHLLAGGS